MAAMMFDDRLPTPEELDASKRLRARFAEEFARREAAGRAHPCLFGDLALARVLRGNDGDLAQAEAWLARCLQKVSSCRLDSVISQMTDRLDANGGLIPQDSMLPFHGEIGQFVRAVFTAPKKSSTGDLINYVSFSQFDTWAFMETVEWQHWVQYMYGATVLRMVECERQSRVQGRMVRVITLIDVGGCSFSMLNCLQFHMRHNRELGKFQESVAAEIFGPVFVINAPALVHRLFATVSYVIPRRFAQKVRLLEGDGLDDAAFVALVGGAEQLRELLAVRDALFADGPLQPSAPLRPQRIAPREVFVHSLDVRPGQRVEWQFEVRPGLTDGALGESDVHFSASAFWTPDIQAKVPACLRARASYEDGLGMPAAHWASASSGRARGGINVSRAGVIWLRWSNQHSTLRGKAIKLAVSVADEHDKQAEAAKQVGANGAAGAPGAVGRQIWKAVPRLQAFVHSMDVLPGQRIDWSFQVLPTLLDSALGASDLVFSVDALWTAPDGQQHAQEPREIVRRLRAGAVEPIVLPQRFHTSRGHVHGGFTAPRRGVVWLRWSNRHGLRSKALEYAIGLGLPHAAPSNASPPPASSAPKRGAESPRGGAAAASVWSCCSLRPGSGAGQPVA